MMKKHIPFLLAAVLLCGSAAGVPVPAAEQVDPAELSASGLLTGASTYLAAGQYRAAIPYLTGYLTRMEGIEDPRVLALSQDVRFKLAKLMAYLDDPAAAIGYLKQYTAGLPLYKPRAAWLLLAVNLYETGAYEECISAAKQALSRPLPQGLAIAEEKVDYDELSKKERGGFTSRQLRRLEKKESAEEQDELAREISAEMPDPEPDYTQEELLLLNMTLGESCFELTRWEESLEFYRFVTDNEVDESRKAHAILQTVKALVALERFDEAKAVMVTLCRTGSRYDIRVNMALIEAASAFHKAGEYDSALLLYRMVLPRGDMVAHQEMEINKVRRSAGLPQVSVTVITNEQGRAEPLFSSKYDEVNASKKTADPRLALPPKPEELIQLEESVRLLVALPPYEDNVLYETGRLYAESGRPWEAVAALEVVAGRDPDHEIGQRAFAEALMVLIDPLKKYQRVEQLGTEYLDTYIEGLGPRLAAYALTVCYQKQERWDAIKKLLPVIEKFVFSEENTIRQYQGELYFMQAIADMMLFHYEQAEAGFARVLADYPDPGSVRDENASYWQAAARLFQKKYPEALADFDAHIRKYPDGSWVPSSVFYSGVCLFGMEKNDDAQQCFTRVIDNWPDATVYSDACSMRGDLLAAKGGDWLDAAQQDYERAIASARNPRQDTYAVFQMVAMFDLENRHQEIVDVTQAYLDRRGEAADVAKAAYWIGKTRLAQGRIDEAVETYRDTVLKYGGNILQDGVDLIISEMVKVSRRMDAQALSELKAGLEDSVKAAENETLRLRLRVLLAKMNHSEIALGKILIKELPDLTQAPPPVLAVICDASFAAGDYSRAKEILTLFQTRYEDSDFMRAAYKLRGFDLYQAQDEESAMKIIAEAQSAYGTDPDMAWAQLMKGRIELRQGRLNEAREAFLSVLNVREWRGEAYAEATFLLGQAEEQGGDLLKAFAWYQRAYFQYKGYSGGYWAAEGYLASARCLQKLGLENDRRNTFRAMLFDKYVNTLPQADVARTELGAAEVLEISRMIEAGTQTNLTVTIDTKGTEE